MASRILLLHTGGTLGMAPSGTPSSLAPGPYLDHLLERVPELRELADLRLEVPFNCDSATLEPERILDLARLIREGSAGVDGIVLIHGTDTMAFSASVLGFMLADLGKPVVLTGSQRPLAYVRSDARTNLINAVDLATRGVAEVGICFGSHWIRGDGTVAQWDGVRAHTGGWPVGTVTAELRVPVTVPPGEYEIVFDLVDENVTWFEWLGAPTARRRVVVEPEAR